MGMVTRHYKYIEHRKNQDEYPLYPITKGTIEVYDLSTDPGEENNLAQDLPDLAKQLKRRMNQYLSFRSSHPPLIEGVVDPKTEERLKALGYTE